MERSLVDAENVERRLGEVLHRLREQTPQRLAVNEPQAEVDLTRFERKGDTLIPRAVITLRSVGCGWARSGGGCTMCGHFAGRSPNAPGDAERQIAQFDQAFAQVDWSGFPILCLYNGGSLLNPEELPEQALTHILARIAAEPGITDVVVETRAQYVTEARLTAITQGLAGRRLTVAMGLESASEEVRRLCVHKGFSLNGFAKACQLVRRFGRLRLYVLIKPPWLTEHEMIEDAVASIRLAHELLADDVHFEPLTIQRHTLLNLLWRQGKYRLPWLWSVIEVLKRVSPQVVYLSPFAHVPRPIAIPHNCGRCDDEIRRLLLGDYNKYGDLRAVSELRCPCRDDWREELQERDPRPLALRVAADLPDLMEALSENRQTTYLGARRSEPA